MNPVTIKELKLSFNRGKRHGSMLPFKLKPIRVLQKGLLNLYFHIAVKIFVKKNSKNICLL